MPMKTVASLIAMVAIGTWAYFGIIETQNRMLTKVEIMEKDLEMNSEFRIKWPRGQLGSLPADSEQFMICLLYTSPSPRDRTRSRMPSSA